ncbi:MAG: prepilin-type N-terminal cleavage/methylation domain-containing protein [bacterium]|nr:prepilin-type N-terminal cleavage/methylation domain-containing protein [bacterium]
MVFYEIRNNKGMTLVEVVVAMVLAAVVVFIIYGALDTTFRLGKRGLSEVERLEEARLAMDYITRDLSGAISFAKDKNGNVIFQGRKGDAVGLDNDSLILVVGNRKEPVKGKPVISFQEVSYTVEPLLASSRGGNDFESRIFRSTDENIDGQIDTTKTVRGLGVGVPKVKYGLRFRYWDTRLPIPNVPTGLRGSTETGLGPDWIEEWMNRPGLPKRVMVIVTVQHPNEPGRILRLSTVVRLMSS